MRIAWTGPVGEGGGVPAMGMLMLRELLRQGVEVDLYAISFDGQPAPVIGCPPEPKAWDITARPYASHAS